MGRNKRLRPVRTFKIDEGVYIYLKEKGPVNPQLLEAFPEALQYAPTVIATNQLKIEFNQVTASDKSAKPQTESKPKKRK